MSERPWMPMYWGDYLADTRDLDPDEHGTYLFMIAIAWMSSDGGLPSDKAMLKRMIAAPLHMHGHQFNRIVPRLLKRFWTLNEDGLWQQKRVVKERQNARKRSANASQSAAKRWSDARNAKGLADAAAMHARASTTTLTKKETQSPSTQPETLPPQSVTETTSPSQTAPPLGANGHAKQKSQVKGTRLSEDWRPSDDAIRHCRENLGASTEILNREYEAFMDWGLSACGQVALKRDWDRAFINWIRRVMNGIREQEARERRWAEQRSSKH